MIVRVISYHGNAVEQSLNKAVATEEPDASPFKLKQDINCQISYVKGRESPLLPFI